MKGTYIWDAKTFKLLRTHDGVTNISFSPDGSLLVSLNPGTEIRIWDAKTGVHLRSLASDGQFSFSPDGQLLAVQKRSSTVELWDVNTGILLHTLTGRYTSDILAGFGSFSDKFMSLLFSPDGKMLLGENGNDTVQFWDVKTGASLGTIGYLDSGYRPDSRLGSVYRPDSRFQPIPRRLSFSPDGEILASVVGTGGNVVLVRFASTSRTNVEDIQLALPEGAKARYGKGGIGDIEYSSDGRRLAAARPTGIWLYDGQTGELINQLSTHKGEARAITFSTDGQLLASASANDPTVHLWDANAGSHLRTLEGHTDEVFDVAFSPDGQLLASGSADRTVRLWDVSTWHLRHTFEAHTQGPVHIVAFSPDEQTFASVSNSENLEKGAEIRLWDTSTWHLRHTFTAAQASVSRVSFSPGGEILASMDYTPGGPFRTVGIWDVSTGRHLHTFNSHWNSFTFSPDGKIFAITKIENPGITPDLEGTGWAPVVHLWEVSPWRSLEKYEYGMRGHTGTAVPLFSPDGKILITRTEGSGVSAARIDLWDVSTWSLLRTLPPAVTNPFFPILLSPDGEVLVEVGGGGLYFWEVGTGKLLHAHTGDPVNESHGARSAFSPDGQLLAYTTQQGCVLLNVMDIGSFLNPIPMTCSFSPDGQIIVGFSKGRELRRNQFLFLDANTGKYLFDVQNGTLSPDGSLLVVSSDEVVVIYEVSKLRVEDISSPRVIEDNRRGGYARLFSPDGQRLATWEWPRDRKVIHLWDMSKGQVRHTFEGHTDDVWHTLFSPDGRIFASVSEAETILWDVNTGQALHTFEGHTDERRKFGNWDHLRNTWYVSFSPDGRIFASVSETEAILRDVNTGRVLLTFEGNGHYTHSFSPDGQLFAIGFASPEAHAVRFSPDGQLLTVGFASPEGHAVRVWDVTTGSLLHTFYEEYHFAFSPDGQLFASVNGSDINLRDVSTWELRSTIRHYTSGIVQQVIFSPDGSMLASMDYQGHLFLWDVTSVSTGKQSRLAADVNGDGKVNVQDLVAVNSALLTEVSGNNADVNQDGIINIADLVLVAAAIATSEAAAPAALRQQVTAHLTPEDVQHWLTQARHANLTDTNSQRGIRFLEELLSAFIPKETALLANYPNPFNPETWIPYQLANPADVNISIYAVDGTLVRTLDLGHQAMGSYQGKSRAAYWDGRNAVGEPVASGVYFYTLSTESTRDSVTAGTFTATRKMLILK